MIVSELAIIDRYCTEVTDVHRHRAMPPEPLDATAAIGTDAVIGA
jgi:hypothetical protein